MDNMDNIDNKDSIDNADIIKDTSEQTNESIIENIIENITESAEESFKMPEGAEDGSRIVGHDFWKGITLPETELAPKKRSPKHIVITIVTSIVFVAAGFGIACVSARGKGVLSNLVTGGKHMTFSLPMSEQPEDSGVEKDENGMYTAQGIAEKCSPSVVSLDIYSEDSEFVPVGQGSGIILSKDGYIVSNAHVVDKGTKAVKAVLSDGREYAAEIIGSDPKTDIAVIKIPATDLSPAEFASSANVKLGEEVVAIGTPAGYRNSVTKGIVSGLDRKIRLENSSSGVNCIQIDAAVNPGNSGGALFNMYGQVIGITSSKLSSVDYEGIGFAISSDEASGIIEQLIEYGHVADRAKIGITFYQISSTTADIYGVKAGICVASIDESCDVANTELEVGDIITNIDGTDTGDCDDVPALVNKKKAGDEVTCHVYREKTDTEPAKEFDITFKLMEDSGSLTEADNSDNDSSK